MSADNIVVNVIVTLAVGGFFAATWRAVREHFSPNKQITTALQAQIDQFNEKYGYVDLDEKPHLEISVEAEERRDHLQMKYRCHDVAELKKQKQLRDSFLAHMSATAFKSASTPA